MLFVCEVSVRIDGPVGVFGERVPIVEGLSVRIFFAIDRVSESPVLDDVFIPLNALFADVEVHVLEVKFENERVPCVVVEDRISLTFNPLWVYA